MKVYTINRCKVSLYDEIIAINGNFVCPVCIKLSVLIKVVSTGWLYFTALATVI